MPDPQSWNLLDRTTLPARGFNLIELRGCEVKRDLEFEIPADFRKGRVRGGVVRVGKSAKKPLE
jgi:hypothetical protein